MADESHLPGIAPLVPLGQSGSPHSRAWAGYRWSPWCSMAVADPGDLQGIYRLRRDQQELFFLGQGQIADRLRGYRKLDGECSWVGGTWHYHQQLEIVCDLVASYLLTCAALPPAQFGMLGQDGTLPERQVSSPDRAWWLLVLDLIGKPPLHESRLQEWVLATG